MTPRPPLPTASDARQGAPEPPPAWAGEMTEAGPLLAPSVAAPAPQQLALFLPEELEPAPARPTRLPRRIKALLTAIEAQRKSLGRAGTAGTPVRSPAAPSAREASRPRPTLWPDSFFDE